MEKISSLLLVLMLASVASASYITLTPIPEGEPGSATNPLMPSDTIDILANTDTSLYNLNALLTITGGTSTGEIIRAIQVADCAAYGWDTGASFDPMFAGDNSWADIAVGSFSGSPTGDVAYFKFHCTGGPGTVILELTPSTSRGGSADMYFLPPTIEGTITIYQIPEPMTIALLGLGGLLLLRRRR